jgi:ribosomal protein S14
MLHKCPNCGKEISKNARICPHCKCDVAAFKPQETERCRTCGTPLPVKEHRAMVYKSDPTILDRSPVSAHTVHKPCPKCGDPRPLDRKNMSSRTGLRVLAAGLLLAAITAAAAYFLYLG